MTISHVFSIFLYFVYKIIIDNRFDKVKRRKWIMNIIALLFCKCALKFVRIFLTETNANWMFVETQQQFIWVVVFYREKERKKKTGICGYISNLGLKSRKKALWSLIWQNRKRLTFPHVRLGNKRGSENSYRNILIGPILWEYLQTAVWIIPNADFHR